MRLAVYKGEANQLNFQMACPLGRSLLTGLGANLLAHLPDGEQKTRIIEEYGKYFDFASEPPSTSASVTLSPFCLFITYSCWRVRGVRCRS